MVKRLFLLLLLASAFSLNSNAQRTFTERENMGNALLFSLSLGFHNPGGDLKNRFGSASSVGSGLEFITKKGNFLLGLDGNFFYGSRVKEDVLQNMRMPDGEIVGSDGVYSSVVLRQRGFSVGFRFGKIFSMSKVNPRSGIKLAIGAGMLQHQIRVQDDSRQVNQIAGAYKKGYDRLTNGFSIFQFLGYQLLSVNRLINFYAGLEFTQAFTLNRRDWDFFEMTAETGNRLDLLSGFRFGWILPFYSGRQVADSYYY